MGSEFSYKVEIVLKKYEKNCTLTYNVFSREGVSMYKNHHLLLLLVLTISLSLFAQDDPNRVLVRNFRSSTLDTNDMKTITNFFANELRKFPDYNVISFEEAAALADQYGATITMDCDDDRCLEAIAGAIDAPFIVSGEINDIAGRFIINISMLSVYEATTVKAVSEIAPDLGASIDLMGVIAARIAGRSDDGFNGGKEGFSSENSNYNFTNQQQKIIVKFTSSPSGAVVFVDDQLVAQSTPGQKALSVGTHSIRMMKDLYHNYSGTVTVSENGQIVNGELLPAFGYLTLNTSPSGIPFTIDGEAMGTTPVTRKQLSEGSHTISFGGDCYLQTTGAVNISSGETKVVDRIVEARMAGVSIEAVDSVTGMDLIADIYVGEEVIGSTPFYGTIPLCNGTVRVRLSNYRDEIAYLSLVEGQTITETIYMNRGSTGKRGRTSVGKGGVAQQNFPTRFSIGDILSSQSLRSGDENIFVFTSSATPEYVTVYTESTIDTKIEVYGPNLSSSLLTEDDDGGEDSNGKVSFLTEPESMYQIKVKGYDDETRGRFSLHSSAISIEIAEDEPNNTIDDANTITFGELYSSSLMPLNDTDFYRIYIPANFSRGKLMTLETVGEVDTKLSLYDSNKNLVAENDDGGEGNNALISSILGAQGHFYVKVVPYENELGPYQIKQTVVDATDIDFETPYNGNLSAQSSINLLKFTIPQRFRDTHITIQTKGSLDTQMELFDPYGAIIGKSDDEGEENNALTTLPVSKGDVLYAKVNLYNSENYGSYSLHITPVTIDLDEDEPNNSMGTAFDITFGDAYEGSITPTGDVDFYRVELPRRSSPTDFVTFSTIGDEVDTKITLLDESGNELATNDDGGEGDNAQISTVVGNNSFFFIKVEPYGTDTGVYGIELTQNDVAEVPFDQPKGGFRSEFSDENPIQLFSIEVPSNTGSSEITIETRGNLDTKMRVYNSSGEEVGSSDDEGNGENARLALAVNGGDMLFIIVEPYSDDHYGSFTLHHRL